MSVRVMSWVLDSSPVTHRGDLLVLIVLADHAHDDGTSAYPAVETIAAKARLTRRGAQIALRRLEALGAIRPAGKGPRGVVAYRVVMDPEEAQPLRSEVAARAKSQAPGGEVDDTGGRSHTHLGAKGSSPEPSKNHQEEPSLETPSVETGEDTVEVLEDAVEARDLFAYWQQRCDKPRARPTPDRLRKVRARLRDGYTATDIRRAIDGAARSPFVNEQGRRFDDLELICRSGSKLEDFIARADDGPAAGFVATTGPRGPRRSGPSAADFYKLSQEQPA